VPGKRWLCLIVAPLVPPGKSRGTTRAARLEMPSDSRRAVRWKASRDTAT
jgi:hypothetical protein